MPVRNTLDNRARITHTADEEVRGRNRMRISLPFRIEERGETRRPHIRSDSGIAGTRLVTSKHGLPSAATLSDLSFAPATFKASYLTHLFSSLSSRFLPRTLLTLSLSILPRYYVNTITSYHNAKSCFYSSFRI